MDILLQTFVDLKYFTKYERNNKNLNSFCTVRKYFVHCTCTSMYCILYKRVYVSLEWVGQRVGLGKERWRKSNRWIYADVGGMRDEWREESKAEQNAETEQSAEAESRAESRSRRGDTERRGRGDAEAKAEQNRQSLVQWTWKCASRISLGEARSFIGSAQQQSAAKGAHLAPLTSLIGADHARGCIRRACVQRGLRGALQARGAHECVV